MVSRAAPDGYTLCVLSSSFTTNAAIQPNLRFDAVNGFSPVAMIAKGPMLLTVANHVPAKTTLELFALARKDPGKLNYGSSVTGGTPHLAGEMFKSMAGVNIVRVGAGAPVLLSKTLRTYRFNLHLLQTQSAN